MGQPVEYRTCEAVGAEDFGPFVEGQVRGDDDRAAFITLGDHLEEQLGAGLGEWYEAEFVNDQQILSRELFLQPLQTAFIGGFDEFVDQL